MEPSLDYGSHLQNLIVGELERNYWERVEESPDDCLFHRDGSTADSSLTVSFCVALMVSDLHTGFLGGRFYIHVMADWKAKPRPRTLNHLHLNQFLPGNFSVYRLTTGERAIQYRQMICISLQQVGRKQGRFIAPATAKARFLCAVKEASAASGCAIDLIQRYFMGQFSAEAAREMMGEDLKYVDPLGSC